MDVKPFFTNVTTYFNFDSQSSRQDLRIEYSYFISDKKQQSSEENTYFQGEMRQCIQYIEIRDILLIFVHIAF